MKRLVCIGKTYQLRGDDETQVPAIGEIPRRPQKVRLEKRQHLSIVPEIRKKHNGYKPGKLLDLCADQCRFSIGDGIFCGIKVVEFGSAWCEQHRAVVYPAFRKYLEAAE